jgi:mono/diheme cytochrome c family protein
MFVRLALCASAFLLGSSARADDAEPLTPRDRGDLAIAARAILKKYCAECHGEKSGQTSLSVLDYKQITAKAPPVPFVNLDDPAHSQVIEFIEDGSMPPGGRPRPTADEIAKLRAWVQAKAPGYPRAFDDPMTLATMLDDWTAQEQQDRPHLRYISLAHLIHDDRPLPDLKSQAFRLQQALAAASGETAALEPVDSAATIFRLDLRTLGWDTLDLFSRIEKGLPQADVYPIIPFDLILLEYPPGLAPAADDALKGPLQSFLAAAKQARPVPYLRGDWLAAALAPGSALAADLKSLVDLGKAQDKKEDLCGPPMRPFPPPSADQKEPARTPPLTAWYARDAVPEPPPFNLQFSLVDTSDKKSTEPVIVAGQSFHFEAACDREVRFILLNVLSTGDIRPIPVSGGNIVKPGMPRRLTPETGQPFRIPSLLSGKPSETEHFILIAAESNVPLPTITRSRHSDSLDCSKKDGQPIWRFLFDSTDPKFDPARAVRRVIPVKVEKKE